jgi:hypothetical protein
VWWCSDPSQFSCSKGAPTSSGGGSVWEKSMDEVVARPRIFDVRSGLVGGRVVVWCFDPPTFLLHTKHPLALGRRRRREKSVLLAVKPGGIFSSRWASGGGGSRGSSPPSQVRCILMMPLLAHSAQNARNPYSSNTTPNRRLEQFKR